MSEESLLLICPNPKCRRQIAEPILLTVLSIKPQKKYEACPHCFTELKKPETEQEIEPEELQEEIEAPESAVEEEDKELIETEDNLPETETQESSKESGSGFLGKVKEALLPSIGSKTETKKKIEEPETQPEVEEAYEDDEDEEIADFTVVEEEIIELSEEPEEDLEEETTEDEEPEPEEKPSVALQDDSEGCPEEFGYLANRPKDAPIPQVCFVCPKMVDCMLSIRDAD